MRKLFLFLIILFSFIKVEAKVYYSEYSDYEEVLEKVEETDLLKTKTEEKYLIYKEDITETFYPSYTEVTDMIKTDETKIVSSEWLDSEPSQLPDKNIIKQQLYEYESMKSIRYIKLSSLINTKSTFDLSEIRILKKGKLIDFDVIGDKDYDILKDKNYNNFISFNKDEEIIIDLKQNIKIEDLMMTYHIHIKDTSDIYFTLSLMGEEKENIYASATIYSILDTINGNDFSYLIFKDHFDLVNPLYDEAKLSEEKVLGTEFNKVRLVTKYKTEDLYIKYYRVDRTYLDEYYLKPLDGYLIDYDTKKEFYYIKTRDKVEIKERLIIDNYNIKLEDFILNTTVDNIKITSNINYYKNGEYDINFILPFKVVKTKVIVDIKENYLKILKKQNKYLKALEEENRKLFIQNNELNVKLKEVLKDKDEAINEVNEKLIKYQYENKSLKSDKKELDEDFEEKSNNKFLVIILSIVSALFITIILRKKSH